MAEIERHVNDFLFQVLGSSSRGAPRVSTLRRDEVLSTCTPRSAAEHWHSQRPESMSHSWIDSPQPTTQGAPTVAEQMRFSDLTPAPQHAS